MGAGLFGHPADEILGIPLDRQNDQTSQRARLTAHEIVVLPDDTSMYMSVGKAYFKESKQAILQKLAETIKGAEEEVKSLQAKKEHVEKGIQSAEQEIRELLQSAPGLAARILPQQQP